jgi:hypothetical protein
VFAYQRFCYFHFSPPPFLDIFGASRLGVLALYLGVQKHFAGGDLVNTCLLFSPAARPGATSRLCYAKFVGRRLFYSP